MHPLSNLLNVLVLVLITVEVTLARLSLKSRQKELRVEAWSGSLGKSLPLSGPQFPKCKIRGWIVGSEEPFGSDLSTCGQVQTHPSLSSISFRVRHFHQPHGSLYVVMKKKEVSSLNSPVRT